MMQFEQWNGFNAGNWQREIDVRSFIQKNYTLYTGDDSFLTPATNKTKAVWAKCEKLLLEEIAISDSSSGVGFSTNPLSPNINMPFSPYSQSGTTITKNAETSLVPGAVFKICKAGLKVSDVE